jgi:outer membrane lipoprotein carrier protein
MRLSSLGLWLILGLAGTAGASAAVVDAEPVNSASIDQSAELIGQLQQIQTLTASYIQTTVDNRQQLVQQARGSVWVSAPGKFRLETNEPSTQTLVSDGETFWSFDEDLEQVVVSRLERDISQVPILLFGGDAEAIADEYLVVFYVLEPREEASLFESLTLTFVAGEPVSIVLRDSLGQRTQIEFSDLVANQLIADGTFTFVPPAGVDLIDDR